MRKKSLNNFEELYGILKRYISNQKELDSIREAYEYAEEKHQGQKRRSGEDYIIHPINTAYRLTDLQASPDVIKAALLHDVIEDTPATYEDIQDKFGNDVAFIVKGVTNISLENETRNIINSKEATIQHIFDSLSKDIRVILVKLSDRLHNMATLEYMDDLKKIRKSHEVIEIYSPIAAKLGLYN
jgi:GTP pyrophosphokinase